MLNLKKILYFAAPALLMAGAVSAVAVSASSPTPTGSPTVTNSPTAPGQEAPGTEKPEAADPAGSAAEANEPTGGGHTDEAAGAAAGTESTVDHQAEGVE
jgi:hypothetical protein